MKHLYYILLFIGFIGATPAMQAQIFSTAECANPFQTTSHYSYSQPSFRSTSSYSTSYEIPTNDFPATPQYRAGRFQTAAARLGNGTLADDAGYISTRPRQFTDDDVLYDEDDTTQAPPQIAPLGFGWDVIILLMLMAAAYVLYLRRRTT